MVFSETDCFRIKESTKDKARVVLPVVKLSAVKAGKGNRPLIYLMSPIKLEGNSAIGGIYRSDDWGVSWVQMNQGLLDQVPNGARLEFSALAVCETRPDVAY